MTPIFGVSLGLMRGDLRLLRKALLAEFGGLLFGVTSMGRILLGEAHFGAAGEADEKRSREVEQAVRTSIESTPDRFAAAVDAVRTLGEPINLSPWARAELQVTAEHYASLGD